MPLTFAHTGRIPQRPTSRSAPRSVHPCGPLLEHERGVEDPIHKVDFLCRPVAGGRFQVVDGPLRAVHVAGVPVHHAGECWREVMPVDRHDSLAGKLLQIQIQIQIQDAPSLVGAGLPAIVRLLTIRPARRAGGGFLGLAVMR